MANCGRGPLQVTDIQVGRDGNVINSAPDGSMQFTDAASGTVKLSDLVNQEVIINPATVVEVEIVDWMSVIDADGRTFYTVDVPHNFNVSNFALVDIVIWDSGYNRITLDNINQKANSALLRSIEPINIFVTMKKV